MDVKKLAIFSAVLLILGLGFLVLFGGQDSIISIEGVRTIFVGDDFIRQSYDYDYNENSRCALVVREQTNQSIADVCLLSPQNKKIIFGLNRTIFELDVTPQLQALPSFINQITYYDLDNNNATVNKPLHLQYRNNFANDTLPTYEEVCNPYQELNLSMNNNCTDIQDGTYEKPLYEWIDFDNETIGLLPKDHIIVRGLTNVDLGEHIEWIPCFFGTEDDACIEITEWATWSESFEVNLVSWWDMDDTSGDQIDQISNYNGTLENGVVQGRDGKIGKSYFFDGTDDYTNVTDQDGLDLINGTISLWVNRSSLVDDTYIVYKGGAGDSSTSNYEMDWDVNNGGMRWNTGDGGGLRTIVGTIDAGVINDWIFVVATLNGTSAEIWINGTFMDRVTYALDPVLTTEPLQFAHERQDAFGTYFQGELDEIGIWNRVLTSAEIVDLWNNNQGLTPVPSDTTPPVANLTSPTNATKFTSSYDVLFNATLYDDHGLSNSTLYVWYINGSEYTQEFTTHSNNYTNRSQLVSFSTAVNNKDFLWNYLVFDNATGGGNLAWGLNNYTINLSVISTDIVLSSILVNPEDNYNFSSASVDFGIQQTISYGNHSNTTLFVWNSTGDIFIEDSNITLQGVNNTIDVNWTETLEHGIFNWSVYSCGTNNTGSKCLWASNSNYTVGVDLLPPLITFTATGDQLQEGSPVNITVDFTATDVGVAGIDSCWFSYTGGSNTSYICGTPQGVNFTLMGNKTITMYANDSYNNINFTKQYADLGNWLQGVNTNTTAEGQQLTFNLSVSKTGIGTGTNNGSVIFNNTEYSELDTLVATDDTIFMTKKVTIPQYWGNSTGKLQDWHWNFSTPTAYEGITQNLTVFSIGIDDCSVFTDVLLNLDLYNEETIVYPEPNASTIEIDLSIESWFDSSIIYTYNATISSNNATICIPNGVVSAINPYKFDFTIGFESNDYVHEFFYLDNGTLNSSNTFNSLTTENISLLDLISADSTSFLFNFFDTNGLVVQDSIAHVFRKYIGEGIFREIERSKADQNGDTIVHLVEEDVIYYFVISQYSDVLYTSSTYTALCQSVPCEITIEQGSGFQSFDDTDEWDLIDGGVLSWNFNSLKRQVNLSYATDRLSKMNLTVYEMESDGEYAPISSEVTTSTSGVLSVDVPASYGNQTFFAGLWQDDDYITSEWVDFEEDAGLYFGNTLSIFLGFLIILSLVLMASTSGSAVIIFLVLGMVISMILGLIDYRTTTGVSVLVYFILAGGMLAWKLTRRQR